MAIETSFTTKLRDKNFLIIR